MKNNLANLHSQYDAHDMIQCKHCKVCECGKMSRFVKYELLPKHIKKKLQVSDANQYYSKIYNNKDNNLIVRLYSLLYSKIPFNQEELIKECDRTNYIYLYRVLLVSIFLTRKIYTTPILRYAKLHDLWSFIIKENIIDKIDQQMIIDLLEANPEEIDHMRKSFSYSLLHIIRRVRGNKLYSYMKQEFGEFLTISDMGEKKFLGLSDVFGKGGRNERNKRNNR